MQLARHRAGRSPGDRRGATPFVVFLVLLVALVAVFAAFEFLARPESETAPSSLESRVRHRVSGDWKLVPLGGGPSVTLQSFKGKVVFLNQWATWCPPCVAEMPSIENLYKKFRSNPNVVFAIVSVDQAPGPIEEFVKERDLTMPIYIAFGEPPAPLSTTAIPATFILDRDFRVASRFVGSRDWDDKDVVAFVEKLLQETPGASGDPASAAETDRDSKGGDQPPKTSKASAKKS